MPFLLSIGLLIVFTFLIVSLFRLTRISEIILSWSLVAFSKMVLIFQIANLFSKLNSISFVLILQIIFVAAAIVLWLKFGKPKLYPDINIVFNIKKIIFDKKNWPILALCLTLFAVFILYIVLIYVVPPNNNDALSIHIARIIKWKQMGNYFPWETPFIWQMTFPVNAQLTFLWTILFTNSDHFIAYIPFLTGLCSSLLVYLLAIEFGFSKRKAILSALIWFTFPVVQLHLTSVRHDLMSTWLFLSSFYFLLRWKNHKQTIYMLLSAVALALVVGTNFSIATYLPGLVIILLIMLIQKNISLTNMFKWGVIVLLAFLLLSSPIYISNIIHFQSPVGPDAADMTSVAMTDEMSIAKYVLINSTRWAYQMLDFSWLPQPIGGFLINAKTSVVETILSPLNASIEGDTATMNAHEFYWNTVYQLQEDEAWFGLIGALLIFPTSLYAFGKGIKNKNVLYQAPFIFLLTSLITCSLIRPGWTPYDGRYFMPLAALCAALLPMWFANGKYKMALQYIVVAISLFSVMMVVAYNPAKQVVGGAAIWNMNRIDRLTRQSYTTKEMLYLVQGAIPEEAVVGIATNNIDYQEYGVFGESFTRTIINVYPPENVSNREWLAQRNVHYLLILVSDMYPNQIAQGFEYVESLGDWVVYSDVTQEK